MNDRGRYRAARAAKKYTNFKVKKLRYTSAKVQKCISTSLISDDGSNQRMVRVVERALIAIAKPGNGPPR